MDSSNGGKKGAGAENIEGGVVEPVLPDQGVMNVAPEVTRRRGAVERRTPAGRPLTP